MISNAIEAAIRRNQARSTIRSALNQLSCHKERLDILADITVEMEGSNLQIQEPRLPQPPPLSKRRGRPPGVNTGATRVNLAYQAIVDGFNGYLEVYLKTYPEDRPSTPKLTQIQYSRIASVIRDLLLNKRIRRIGAAKWAAIPVPIIYKPPPVPSPVPSSVAGLAHSSHGVQLIGTCTIPPDRVSFPDQHDE